MIIPIHGALKYAIALLLGVGLVLLWLLPHCAALKGVGKPELTLVLLLDKDHTEGVITGTIELKNNTGKPISVVSEGCLLQYLDFRVIDRQQRNLASRRYGDMHCLWPGKKVHEVIRPSEMIKSSVVPSAVVGQQDGPRDLQPGVYRIRAVFQYENFYAVSNEVEVVVR